MPQIVTCGSEFLRINAQENSIEYSSNGGGRTWHNRVCMLHITHEFGGDVPGSAGDGGGLVRGDFQGTVLVAERRGDLGDAVQ